MVKMYLYNERRKRHKLIFLFITKKLGDMEEGRREGVKVNIKI